MDHFINVMEKDPQVQMKIRDILDKYKRLLYIYQSKIGYDTLIQNVTPKKIIYLMATAVVEIDIELQKKISRRRYWEKNYYD